MEAASETTAAFRDPTPLARWVTLLLAAFAAVGLYAALEIARSQLVLGAMAAGSLDQLPFARLLVPRWLEEPGSAGALVLLVSIRRTFQRAAVAALVLVVASRVLLMVLLFRVRRNVLALGAATPRYAAHWIVTGWFVPFLNFVRPYQVVADLWRASGLRPDATALPERWSPLPRLWWECAFVVSWLNFAAGSILARPDVELGTAGAVFSALFPLALLNAGLALVEMRLVRGLTALQQVAAGARLPRRAAARPPIAHAGVDLAALGAMALVLLLGYGWGARVMRASLEPGERQRAARESERATESAPAAVAAPDEEQRKADIVRVVVPEEIESGVVGLVEGGVPGGVVGGVPGTLPGDDESLDWIMEVPSAPPEVPAEDAIFFVGGDVGPPKKLRGSQPAYTETARKARLQGTVIVQVVSDQDGNVTSAKILKGLPLGLDEQAIAAVRQWQFVPAMRAGRPVRVYYNLTVNFLLE